MENKLIMSVLAIAVGIIVVGSVLVPIINDASDAQHEYYNNSIGQYSKIIDETVTIEYEYNADDGSFTYTANGVPQTLLYNYNDMIFATSHASFKITYASNFSSYIVWLDPVLGSTRIDSPVKVSATISGDSINATVTKANLDTLSFEMGIDWGFYAVTEGDYRSVWNDPYDVYINSIDQVYSVSWVSTTTEFFSIHGDSYIYGGGDATLSYTPESVNGVIDVFRLRSGDLLLTVDNDGSDYDVIPFNVIVPAEIVGDKASYSDSATSLFKVIPVVVILALLLLVIPLMRRE